MLFELNDEQRPFKKGFEKFMRERSALWSRSMSEKSLPGSTLSDPGCGASSLPAMSKEVRGAWFRQSLGVHHRGGAESDLRGHRRKRHGSRRSATDPILHFGSEN